MQTDSASLSRISLPATLPHSAGRQTLALSATSAAHSDLRSDGNVTISLAGRQRLEAEQQSSLASEDGELVGLENTDTAAGLHNRIASADTLQEQQQILRELAQRDRAVRNHERIHASVGGLYTSAPSFSYERGPDGRLYAVSGEVKIDTSPVPNDPEATLRKAEQIQRAALAVADPSSADRNAAARAAVMAAEARVEITQQKRLNEAESDKGQTVQPDQRTTDAGREADQPNKEDNPTSDAVNEQQQEFNQRLAEVSAQLAELNRKLFDSGAIQQGLTPGVLLDLQV